MRLHDSDGFSLLETIVALAILAGAVTGLVSLFTLSARATLLSRHASVATTLASAKLEELRASAPLVASPPNTLAVNTAGYCDLLNEHGWRVGGCSTSADRAPYIRRWSIAPQAGAVPFTALRVVVTWSAEPAPVVWAGLHVDDVQLATVLAEGLR
jgi:prepilin-type N-terminal cleavage/methylation domain-containing protein